MYTNEEGYKSLIPFDLIEALDKAQTTHDVAQALLAAPDFGLDDDSYCPYTRWILTAGKDCICGLSWWNA